MRKKPQRKRDRFRFSVQARDLSCRQAIVKKIKQQGKTKSKEQRKVEAQQKVIMKKGGRPKLRMYFACSPKAWSGSYQDIKTFCVTESPVACPAWLRKTMLRNLRETAACRFNPVRAIKALDILAAINTEPNVRPSQVQVEPVIERTSIDTKWSLKRAVQTLIAKMGQVASAMLHFIRTAVLGKRIRICPARPACNKQY